MVEFEVSFSQGGKKWRLPFPQNGPIRGSKTLEIGVQVSQIRFPDPRNYHIGSIFGDSDAPARGNRQRLGWSIRPSDDLIS